MSNVFSMGSRLHVYLTQDPERTGCFDRLRQLTYESYDRDVAVDLELVKNISEKGLIVLLCLQEILLQGGHQLILQHPSPTVTEWLSDHRVTHLFSYE